MAHGTPRRCPLRVSPKNPTDRSMTREGYRYLDHVLRSVWRERGTAIQAAIVDLAIYGHASLDLEPAGRVG